MPPPRERPRPLDERIAAVSKRAKPIPGKSVPVAPPSSLKEELALREVREAPDWERRRNQHLNFLAGMAKCDQGEAFFLIREYLFDRPRDFIGKWIPEKEIAPGVIDEGYWVWDYGFDDRQDSAWQAEFLRVRQHIITTFEEMLGEAVCSHGESWKDFTLGEKGCIGCPLCFVEFKLARRGMTGKHIRAITTWAGSKEQYGNTRAANTILWALGLGVNNGKLWAAITASNLKLAQIADARANSTGRVKPKGSGPDSFAADSHDKIEGEQAPAVDIAIASLPAFDKKPGVPLLEIEEKEE